ncbi:MAG: hypothetical protein O3A59_01515 [Nitrospirae bacterium]|nr:hypothetical protein [Nitrospirota bacterium]
MAQKLAPLKQSSPKSRIRQGGSAASEGGKPSKKQSPFLKFKCGGQSKLETNIHTRPKLRPILSPTGGSRQATKYLVIG